MLFWAIAALLTIAALLFVLPPLVRNRSSAPDAHIAANATIYREQLDELGADLQRGALTQEEFEHASREIEHRIVSEYGAPAVPQPAKRRAQVVAALAVGLLLPLAVALVYWQLGEPRALLQAEALPTTPHEMEALAEKLAERLQASPQDPEGWVLLGRSLSALGKHGQAAQALGRALQLMPEDRELLMEFINILALGGRVEFESGNYPAAVSYWERILPFAPPQSEFARSVAESIAEARSLGGSAAAASAATKDARSQSLQGVVSIDPALAAKLSPGDTVFVLARPVSGSRMPLAVARTTAAALPYRYTLDDSMAMAPGATLSSHAKVVVVARVSKSGNAMPQKGDLEGASAPVAPGASDVNVVLSRIVE